MGIEHCAKYDEYKPRRQVIDLEANVERKNREETRGE
jgi:hypothetical protein